MGDLLFYHCISNLFHSQIFNIGFVCHFIQTRWIIKQFVQCRRKPFNRKLVLGNCETTTQFFKRRCVRRLVWIDIQRYQYRRPTNGFKFDNRTCPASPDNQIRINYGGGHIANKRQNVRANFMLRIKHL